MTKIPGSLEVNRSLLSVRRSLKSCLRSVNQNAAKLLAKGQYEKAEALVAVARRVDTFRGEVIALEQRWKEVKGTARGGAKSEITPLWEYYQPVLKAIVSLGGEANTREITTAVQPLIEQSLKPGDFEALAGGHPRWLIMVRRTKKAMRQEGFLAVTTGQAWKITAAGRKAAVARKVG